MLGEFFDPKAETNIYEHCRPHWSQAGAVVFITFRTADSIPREVVELWDQQKQEWLRTRGHNSGTHWSEVVPQLTVEERGQFLKHFNRCRENFLDTCHGRCLLQHPELAQIVARSLLHFDGERYRMGDFVIMPNHVHLLAVFGSDASMKEQCDSWLHYTARQINLLTNSMGKFWQQEPFDHIVRSGEQYERLRDYIANNPLKARLASGKYLYRRYPG